MSKNSLIKRQWAAEKKLRQLKLEEAMNYYFVRPPDESKRELERALRKMVFGNWLQEHVEGKQFVPIRAVAH